MSIEKYLIFILTFTLSLLAGCKKEKIPVISTNQVSNVTESTATCGGNITDDGGAAVTVRGICWSISDKPSTADSKTTDGSGSGSFSSSITGLSGDETYYIRAYATNSVGTGYGLEVVFKTPLQSPGPPIAITLPAKDISRSGATLNGIVYANYSVTGIGYEWGTTESYGSQVFRNGAGINGGTFTNCWLSIYSTIDQTPPITPGTLYHYRIVASNSYGTTYGDDMTFTTLSK